QRACPNATRPSRRRACGTPRSGPGAPRPKARPRCSARGRRTLRARCRPGSLPRARGASYYHRAVTAVDRAYETARAAWPGVELDLEVFARWIGERGDVAKLNARDLYLACACAHGDATALATFDERVLPAIDSALARSGAARIAAEVKQRLREKL